MSVFYKNIIFFVCFKIGHVHLCVLLDPESNKDGGGSDVSRGGGGDGGM